MSGLANFDPENPDNLEDIEKQFAVKAVQQMSTYWSLLSSVPPSKLKLTKYDDEILEEFYKAFPEYDEANLAVLNEDELKSKEGKEKWREFIKNFEEKVEDYNFGTLVRKDVSKDYSEENTIFVVRIQFYAIELVRNKLGLNDWVYEKK